MAIVLSAADAGSILERTPEPFTADTPEKRAALKRFQPHGVLVSSRADRAPRRRLNEAVLETARPVHDLAEAFLRTIDGEVDEMLRHAAVTGTLTWNTFATGWWRIVRRIVLGDAPQLPTLTPSRPSCGWATKSLTRSSCRSAWGRRCALGATSSC